MPGLITNILQQPIRWQLLAQAALARLPVDHRSDGVELSALNVAALGVSNIAIRSSALDAAIHDIGVDQIVSESRNLGRSPPRAHRAPPGIRRPCQIAEVFVGGAKLRSPDRRRCRTQPKHAIE